MQPSLTLPNPPNPNHERWVYYIAFALLALLAVYVFWPAPPKVIYTDGRPAILAPAAKRKLSQQIASDIAEANRKKRLGQAQHDSAGQTANKARLAERNAQFLHQQFKNHALKPLSAASTADSVRKLARFVSEF